MSHVEIYTDGAARGNPNGPGGYGAILRFTDSKGQVHEKELSEGFNPTSNNRMEDVDLYSDSSYLINAVNKGWLSSWQKNGWKTADKSPVKNRDLWERFLRAKAPHRVTFHWVKGHAGHPENERCDTLATTAADAMRGTRRPNLDEHQN